MSILKKVLSLAKNLFVKIFSDWKNILILTLAAVLLCTYFNYKRVSNDYQDTITEQVDTISSYKNKVGEMYSQIGTYISDIEKLKKMNSDLYSEVKNLKDNPIIITKIETVTEIKEIHVTDTLHKYDDFMYKLPFRYSDQYAIISGECNFDTSELIGSASFDKISFPNNITLSLIESNKGQLSFIAKSDNPYCQINNMNGVVISPEDSKAIKKRFDKPWVLVLGVGGTVAVVDGKVAICPGIQLTFGRKIFAF